MMIIIRPKWQWYVKAVSKDAMKKSSGKGSTRQQRRIGFWKKKVKLRECQRRRNRRRRR